MQKTTKQLPKMFHHSTINTTDLHKKIMRKEIRFGGNNKLHIYGLLHCKSGKRLNKENRVFFISEKEALDQHYRPCGHCMKAAYKKWKDGLI